MKDEDLAKITNSIQEKLGKENSALIADDLGLLMSSNTKVYNTMVAKDDEITRLKNDKEKLVIANGNLLQQIDASDDYSTREQKEVKEEKSFNFRDAFDENGRFKK